MKSNELISIKKKEYYLKNRDKILARYKKRMYDLKKKDRYIPFAKFRTPDEGLLPEHCFGFSGKDIAEEREWYYLEAIR